MLSEARVEASPAPATSLRPVLTGLFHLRLGRTSRAYMDFIISAGKKFMLSKARVEASPCLPALLC